MKKTKKCAAIAVLSAIAASIFVSSCSSEYTEEIINNDSMRQEKIAKLAQEYGLHIEFNDDISATRAVDERDIEDEMAMMSSLLGIYEISGEQNDNTIILCGLTSNLLSANAAITSSESTGNADLSTTQNETIYGINGANLDLCFEIKISLHWDFSIHNTASIVGSEILEIYSGSLICPTITNKSITVSGGTPTINFSCDLGLTGILGNYYYRVSGYYCPSTQIGSLQII